MNRLLRLIACECIRLHRVRYAWAIAVLIPLMVAPVIGLLLGQLVQLAGAQRSPPAVVGVAEVPAVVVEHITHARIAAEGDHPAPQTVRIIGPSAALLVHDLAGLVAADAAESTNDEAQRERWRREVCRVLRAQRLPVVVVALPREPSEPLKLAVAVDYTHPQADAVRQDVEHGLDAWKDSVIEARLHKRGMNTVVLDVLDDRAVTVSDPTDELAYRWAGGIGVLAVLISMLGCVPLLGVAAAEPRAWFARWLTWSVTGGVAAVVLHAAVILMLVLGGGAWTDGGVDPVALSGLGDLVADPALAIVPAVAALTAGIFMAIMARDAERRGAWLAPLSVLVTGLASAALIDGLRPSFLTDLIPITGAALVVKSTLQGYATGPHLLVVTLVHLVVGLVGARIMHRERDADLVPAGEALAVFSLATGFFTLVSPLFYTWSEPMQVAAPLVVGVLGTVVLHAHWRNGRPSRDWSLTPPPLGALFRAGLAIPWLALLGSAIGALQPEVPAEVETGAEILDSVGHVQWWLALTCMALTPAICEELLFRGVILGLLRRSLGVGTAIVVSSLLFAAMHGSPYRFLPQAAVGVALAVITMRCGSIIPAMLLHAGYNAVLWATDVHGDWLLAHVPGATGLLHLPALAALGFGMLGTWSALALDRQLIDGLRKRSATPKL